MTINDLLNILNQIPESQRDNAIHVFDHQTGTYYPIYDIHPYYPKNPDELSIINPLQIDIKGDNK